MTVPRFSLAPQKLLSDDKIWKITLCNQHREKRRNDVAVNNGISGVVLQNFIRYRDREFNVSRGIRFVVSVIPYFPQLLQLSTFRALGLSRRPSSKETCVRVRYRGQTAIAGQRFGPYTYLV